MKNLRMKAARVGRDLSQEELAARVGVTRQTIGMIEAGRFNPSLALCVAICRERGGGAMKLYLKTKNVLDEREMQEVYRIEHRGLWGMYTLLCAAVVLQMLFGAGFAQTAARFGH